MNAMKNRPTPTVGPIVSPLHRKGPRHDRGSVRVPTAWIETAEPALPPGTGAFCHDPHTPPELAGTAPVKILLHPDVPATEAAARAAIEAGRRVYVLVPAGWHDSSAVPWLSGVDPCQVLLRQIDAAPCAAVLDDTVGAAWVGAHGPGPWRVELSEQQRATLRALFVTLWWTDAEAEAWPDESWLHWCAVDRAPRFADPMPDLSQMLRRPRPGEPDRMAANTRVAVLTDDRVPRGFADRVITSPSGANHDTLARLIEKGARVQSAAPALPPARIGAEAWVEPASARWALRLSLTDAQADALEAIAAAEPSWRFVTRQTMAELHRSTDGRQIWWADDDEPCSIAEHAEVDGGLVDAPRLCDAGNVEPGEWPDPPKACLSYTHHWQVTLPTAPKKSREADLVKAWARYRENLARWTEAQARADEEAIAAAGHVPDGAPEQKPSPPAAALPSVGRLVRVKRSHLLLIDDWTVLDEGEREAERLGARLVAAHDGSRR